MYIQTSVETRWFIPGDIPADVVLWFQDSMAVAELSRVDTYLHTPSAHNLGIKLREGRVEIKQRSSILGLHVFHHRVTGIVEKWRKWSFATEGSEYANDIQSDIWISVTKERMLRRYQVTPGRELRPVPGWLYPLQRSTIEIANIRVKDTTWWSLNLEVVGTNIDLFSILLATADKIFEKDGIPPLTAVQSLNYPQWLDLILLNYIPNNICDNLG